MIVEDAAVPVIGVFAHTDISDDDELWERFLQRPYTLLYDALLRIGFTAGLVLVGRDAEEHDGEDAYLVERLTLLDELIDREAVLARHGLDLFTDARAMDDKEGSDEVRGFEGSLTDEGTEIGGHAQTAQTSRRIHCLGLV